ncbi:PP2C family protein-serine/threonine phosphatase [Wenzhouxiangella sp. EGI_FJ10305]|uniref:PP2C family protein-serine/threonine phosphatase n=1 Tax=Wenzhouxiangella sp. EGI_FJ10305 TaxID=3243768 RepID=UPI0035DCB0F1
MNSVTQDSGSRRSASVSDIGRVRRENQDAVLADDELGLWLVADGMGGHAGGARASVIARDTVRERILRGAGLVDAVTAAHEAIRSEQLDNPEFNDMGTTIVALVEREGRYEVCWVGDSRAYRFSPGHDRFQQLTSDHNVAGVLVASGALTPDEATRHPQRHVLTDCLGLAGEQGPRIDVLEGEWQPGDMILLCSDGLSGELGDGELERIVRSAGATGARGLVDTLLQDALASGAHDNVSAVAVAAPPEAQRSRWKWPFGRR